MTLQIQTITGRWIDPWRIQPEDVDILDIARALAMQCRFAGHVKAFYSVAQHSVLVANQVARETINWPHDSVLAALLHDASEAYLGDITRPMKHHREMEQYRYVEQHVQRTINSAFGLRPNAHNLLEIVAVDRGMVYWEQHYLCYGTSNDNPKPKFDVAIHSWDPARAEEEFMYFYCALEDARGIQPKHLNRPKDPSSAPDAGGGQALPLGNPPGPSPSVGDSGT